MPGEISAIHGGNILGVERMKVECVVPVEKMSSEHLHLIHGRQCGFHAIEHIQRAEPSEVSRANGGKKVEPNIRRRSSMRDNGIGRFLKIVRGQRVVRVRSEGSEIAPGSARNKAKRLRIGRRQRTLFPMVAAHG